MTPLPNAPVIKDIAKDHPLVTVMIPTFNQENVVGEAIESAARQDYPNLEVVICDDASTDGTQAVAERFAGNGNIRYHRNTNNIGRVANYRRLLYELANGAWVINLDGDDCFLDRHYIRRAMSIALSDPEIVLVFSKAAKGRATDADLKILNARFGATRILDGTRFCYEHPPYDRVVPLHLTCLYQRNAALKEGFYELNILSADFDSLYRLMLGHKIGFIDSVSGLWRQHSNNATHALSFEQLRDNYAMLERIYQSALDKKCFTFEEARRWLRRQSACLLLSVMKHTASGVCAPTAPFRMAKFLFGREPGFVVELPSALTRALANAIPFN